MKRTRLFFIALTLLTGMGAKAQLTNLAANWSGNGATGTGSEANNFGWSCNNDKTWGTANGSDVRYVDSGNGENTDYTLSDGTSFASRLLWLRYTNNNDCFTYSLTMPTKEKTYFFSGLIGWHNNSDSPTVTVTIKGAETTYATMAQTIPANTKRKLYPISATFTIPSTETAENLTINFTDNRTNTQIISVAGMYLTEDVFSDDSQNASADITSSVIKDAACSGTTYWTNAENKTGRSTESATNWNDNYETVSTQNGNSDSWIRNQVVTFPKVGLYELKVAVRVNADDKFAKIRLAKGYSTTSSDIDGQLTAEVNGKTTLLIATDGTEYATKAEGTTAGKSFNSKNFSWQYLKIFYVATHAFEQATIGFRMSSKSNNTANAWVGGMQLHYLGSGTSYAMSTNDYIPFGATFAKTSYAYNIAAGSYGTLCLPFDFTVPSGLTAYTLSSVGNDNKVVYGNEVDGTVSAGTAVLLRNQGESAVSGTLESSSAVTVDYT